MRSIGGNGFGKGVNSRFVGVDEVVAGDTGFHHTVGVRASSVLSSVWVVFFLADTTIINDEIEGIFWVSTIATSIIRTAVDQHLFRKDNLAISSNVPGGFDGSNNSESPTASALSLVLDRVHDGSPVSRIRSRGLLQVGFSDISLTESQFRLGLQQKLVLEFFPSLVMRQRGRSHSKKCQSDDE